MLRGFGRRGTLLPPSPASTLLSPAPLNPGRLWECRTRTARGGCWVGRRQWEHTERAAPQQGADASAAAPAAQADDEERAAELKKKRSFRKFSFRGIDLDQMLDLSTEQLMDILHARARRRFSRGLLLKRPVKQLKKKLLKAKKDCGPHDKPDVVKTHLRDMIIIPEMIGSIVGVHQGKVFTTVEIKADMVGMYLGQFSITYKPVRHGRPGIGATSSSKFVPLK